MASTTCSPDSQTQAATGPEGDASHKAPTNPSTPPSAITQEVESSKPITLHHASIGFSNMPPPPIPQRAILPESDALPDTSVDVTKTANPVTPPEKKKIVSLTLDPPIDHDISELQQDFVVQNMFTGLKRKWRDLIEQRSMILGSSRAFHTRFEPNFGTIRDKSMEPAATLHDRSVTRSDNEFGLVRHLTVATLGQLADATQAVLLESWSVRCEHVINQYQRDMRRDLVREALNRCQSVKDKVVAQAIELKPDAHLDAMELENTKDTEATETSTHSQNAKTSEIANNPERPQDSGDPENPQTSYDSESPWDSKASDASKTGTGQYDELPSSSQGSHLASQTAQLAQRGPKDANGNGASYCQFDCSDSVPQ
ncbi:Uu.00g131300.m01.CDS01 [Anthostomella pinea]|uniref:Uu.00g131300.m01.CDS01 n=1 Tax=Anthostomella pinea TaxID=933095 RepID=A0AAI8VJG2_9PEZI|nr:Uu.00g131300.m01.CDS01 [Anthostomella pinea]